MKSNIFISLLFVCICFSFIGCENNNLSTKNTYTTQSDSTTFNETTVYNKVLTETKYMMKLDGKLYVETGETNSMLRCGNMDFNLEFSGDYNSIPTKNGTANFKPFNGGGQYSWRENRVEVCIDDTWCILAYNENDIDGVAMKLIDNTNTSVTIELLNTSDLDIQYGDAYTLEAKDHETGEWFRVNTIIDNYAFNSLAYTTQKGTPSTIDIDFEWLYGKLAKGTYRIVKELQEIKPTDGFVKHWYSVEFVVE